MEMKVVMVLALILLWGIASHKVEGGRATSISEQEDLEMEKELRRLNKPAIKSFQTEYGDIFDCVNINKQPALDHPLLKNHIVQKQPSVFPKGLGLKTSANTPSPEIGLPDGGCPEGTVPIKRITKRDLIWMKSLKGNPSNFHPMDTKAPMYHPAYTREGGYPKAFYGAQGGISIHSAPAAMNQTHRAMITASAGPDGTTVNAIQAGWMVNQDAYGDGVTRLFIYWTADNFVNTGCRDLLCPGFVQLHRTVAPGMGFRKHSVVDGPQYDYYLAITQMNATDPNWWLIGDSVTIGYWPKSLFPGMNVNFNAVEFGGYIFNGDPKTTISPPMGSGEFPEAGFRKAAYFRNIELIRDPYAGFEIVSKEEVSLFEDVPACYRMGEKADLPGWSDGYNFYYGGPGGSNCNLN